jgi:alanine racemase
MNAGVGRLEIDLGALAHNFRFLKDKVGENCIVAPAVKADAYGTGIVQAAKALYEVGARHFFVATLDEALTLRGVLPDCQIAVLGGLMKGDIKTFHQHTITPVLNDPAQIEYWAEGNKQSGAFHKSILHIDTGMNRLGFGSADMDAVLKFPHDVIEHARIETIMSHFACADEKDHPLNAQQYHAFKKAAAHFPAAKKSLANSSGILRDKSWHFDMVRPGMALYGLNPIPETTNPMRAVVKLSVPVLQIRPVKRSESAGYAAGYVFENDTVLATIGLGYADGFLRHLSNKAQVFWNGMACPVRGRVSMDLTIIDIGHIPPEQRPQCGDLIEILGLHQDADTLAESGSTIGYEILTQLGRRYKRIYV